METRTKPLGKKETSESSAIAATGADRLESTPPQDAAVTPVAIETKIAKPLLVSHMDDVAHSRLVTVHIDTPLAEVAALLSSAQISMVVVCDEEGLAAGIVTETILVRQLGFGRADIFSTCAGEVMTRDFIACKPDDLLSDLMALMHQHGLMHVPVVREDKRPMGVVNAKDGLRALLAQGHYEESLLRNYVMGVGYQ